MTRRDVILVHPRHAMSMAATRAAIEAAIAAQRADGGRAVVLEEPVDAEPRFLVDVWHSANAHLRSIESAKHAARTHPLRSPDAEDGAAILMRKIDGGKLGFIRVA